LPPGNKEVNNAHTWWAYNPKQDLVLGNILGGWLLFNKRRQERLGQKSSFAVSNGSSWHNGFWPLARYFRLFSLLLSASTTIHVHNIKKNEGNLISFLCL